MKKRPERGWERFDWGDLGEIRDGGMIEVGLRMKGGGMKTKKTKTGNHWESQASGGESEGSQETEKSEREETEDDIVLQDVMNKAEMEGGPVQDEEAGRVGLTSHIALDVMSHAAGQQRYDLCCDGGGIDRDFDIGRCSARIGNLMVAVGQF